MGYKTVLRTQIKLICNECNHSFILNEDYIRELEKKNGHIPFKAKSSNMTMICPQCNSTNFRVFYLYQNLYRRRCSRCRQMFETERSWQVKCEKCLMEHAEIMAHFGPG